MLKIERTIDNINEEQNYIKAKIVAHEETIKKIDYDLANA
jgi:hypothetical protein